MGGLIASYFLNVLGGHELVRKLITLGTPFGGSFKALETLQPRSGSWLRRQIATMAQTFPSVAELLPQYKCVEESGTWRALVDTQSPPVATDKIEWSTRFHTELARGSDSNASSGVDHHAILGIFQPTPETEGTTGDGDGTVPRIAAVPNGWRSDEPALKFVVDTHGSLPSNQAVHEELLGILTSIPRTRRGEPVRLGAHVNDVATVGTNHRISATLALPDDSEAYEVRLAFEGEAPRSFLMRRTESDSLECDVLIDRPGVYSVSLGARRPSGFPLHNPVRYPLLALTEDWGREENA
jgi:hypothetical protein